MGRRFFYSARLRSLQQYPPPSSPSSVSGTPLREPRFPHPPLPPLPPHHRILRSPTPEPAPAHSALRRVRRTLREPHTPKAVRSEGRSLRLLPHRPPPPPANKKPALGRGRVPHTNINNTNNAMAEFPAYCSRYKGRAKQRAGQSPQLSIFVRVNSPLMGSCLPRYR